MSKEKLSIGQCVRCGKALPQIPIACPDNQPGCCVHHFRWGTCDCEEKMQVGVLGEREKEYTKNSPFTYFMHNEKVVGAFHFDKEHFGENIDYRISQIINPESRLFEILSTTTPEEFSEIKRLAEIKYHQQEIEKLEKK